MTRLTRRVSGQRTRRYSSLQQALARDDFHRLFTPLASPQASTPAKISSVSAGNFGVRLLSDKRAQAPVAARLRKARGLAALPSHPCRARVVMGADPLQSRVSLAPHWKHVLGPPTGCKPDAAPHHPARRDACCTPALSRAAATAGVSCWDRACSSPGTPGSWPSSTSSSSSAAKCSTRSAPTVLVYFCLQLHTRHHVVTSLSSRRWGP